ncbi:unnamed protein product [Somion occarium]|uniref:Exonuclease domain-containing protein n=1 Tax=Somion occarium TaxID=3059160 RepID=A0ABP1D191_9APHY
MFPTLGLFSTLPCPERPNCNRVNCIFSHDPNVVQPPTVRVPIEIPKASSSRHVTAPVPPTSQTSFPKPSVIPVKRQHSLASGAAGSSSNSASTSGEPPKKLQRIGTIQRPNAVSTTVQTNSSGVPLLRVNPAMSQVAIPVRQTMLKNLYDHFVVLYQNIIEANPTLAAEDALRQEEEVYSKTNKLTYRNAVINSISSIKRRPLPDSRSHPSVGTVAEIAKREEDRKKLAALRLTVAQLEPHLLTVEQMKELGYIVDIPPGVGGDQPSEEGLIKTCDRCSQPFKVKRMEEADECVFHYGRPRLLKANGEKQRIYTCCSRTMEDNGCSRGPHVFYESDPEDLHRRHAFTFTRPPISSDQPDEGGGTEDSALDIVALDCEMIYSTGGMTVARVSVVDSMGTEVFDEFVRLDDGVEVIDFNTRFSGINAENYATAVLPLASIRKALDRLINANTIIIGHSLDNDLKTLRMIHHRCVDTVALFPHRAGAPFRRALKDLVKEHLQRTIQSGGATVGHSSVEDSVATLDLVRYYMLNKPKIASTPSNDTAIDVL